MKIRLLSIALLTFSLSLFAQNDVTTRMLSTYFTFPSKPLPKEFSTYSITALAIKDHMNTITSSIKLDGYNHINNDGDLIINFEERPFNVLKTEPQTKEYTEEKDGIKKKVYTYFYNFTYQHGTFLNIKDKTGQTLLSRDLISNNYLDASTPEYGSSKLAADNFKNDANKVGDGEFSNALSRTNSLINSEFGYPKKNFSITLYSVKAKKFTYDKFNQGTDLAVKAIHGIDSLNKLITTPKDFDFSSYSEPYYPFIDMLNQAIILWSEELKESNTEDRKARIDKELTLDLNLNIAVAYIFLRKFDDAIKYSKDAVALGRMNANSSYYDQHATDMKNLYHSYYPEKF